MAEEEPCCKGCKEELDGDQLCCDVCGEHMCSQCGEECACCGCHVCVKCLSTCGVCECLVCDGCIKALGILEYCQDCEDSEEVQRAKLKPEEDRKLARWNAEVAQVKPKPVVRTGMAVVVR